MRIKSNNSKLVLVTGGALGIGLEISIKMNCSGYKVISLDIDEEAIPT